MQGCGEVFVLVCKSTSGVGRPWVEERNQGECTGLLGKLGRLFVHDPQAPPHRVWCVRLKVNQTLHS